MNPVFRTVQFVVLDSTNQQTHPYKFTEISNSADFHKIALKYNLNLIRTTNSSQRSPKKFLEY